jgi:hypothetical protein
MPHTKIYPAKCQEAPGGFRISASLYLYDSPQGLIALAKMDYHDEGMEVMRVYMDIRQFWGFADVINGHIHVWASPNLEQSHLVHLLAHELTHVVLDDVELDEETRADAVGWIARQSMEWAMLIKQDGCACKDRRNKKGQTNGNL